MTNILLAVLKKLIPIEYPEITDISLKIPECDKKIIADIFSPIDNISISTWLSTLPEIDENYIKWRD